MEYFVFDKILRAISDDSLIVRVMLLAGTIVSFIEMKFNAQWKLISM